MHGAADPIPVDGRLDLLSANAEHTKQRSGRPLAGSPEASALRTVLVYALVAVSWILFSDQLVRALFVDPDALTRVASIKGALFVLVTSGLLFVQIRGDLARLQATGERLSASDRRFRRIVDVSPVPMAVVDADENVTLANAAFTALLGYTPEDIPTISDWWPSAYPDAMYREHVIGAWQAEIERSRWEGDAFTPLEVRIRCKDGTNRFMLVSSATPDSDSSEQVVVFFDLTERELAEQSILHSKERLAEVLKSVIGLIGKVVEARDPYTRGHEEGVARIGRQIAEQMGLPESDIEGIEVAGLVHDVGKLGVPAEILTRPGKLTAVENEIVRAHPELGYDILKDIDFGWPVAETVLQHHERMDGSGYPRGLRGEEIPMPVRVLMVADVIEAMAAHRPYRPALGLDAAVAEITSHPEKFDTLVTQACVELYEAGRIEV